MRQRQPKRRKIWRVTAVHGASGPNQLISADEFKMQFQSLKEKAYCAGGRTLMVRGRMPAALVAHAKQKTGISSDSKLVEAALANIAVSDDYGDWLISQRTTISPELDLEF